MDLYKTTSHSAYMSEADWTAFERRHENIDYLDAVFSDMCGVMRGKRIPGSEAVKILTSGLQIPRSLYFLDVTGVNEDIQGMGVSDGDPDGTGWALKNRLVPVPWSGERHAQVLMTMTEKDGSPCLLEPRNILAGVLSRFHEKHLRPVVAVEFEFHLLDPGTGAGGEPLLPVHPRTGLRESANEVYSMEAIEDFRYVLEDITKAALQQNLPVSTIVAEFSASQYEINLKHTDDVLAAADQAVMLRHLVKSVARKHGLRATFMAKPFLEETGNGCHVHVSVRDETGVNIFDDASREGTQALKWAVGGLRASLAEGMAIFAPNLNACRRFGANLFVPVNTTWGYNNRSVALRIPAGDPKARRIEHRVAGADVNPYLLLAAVLGGIDHGLSGRLDPGPPDTGNMSGAVDADIPDNLSDALKRLEGSSLWRDYLGSHYVDVYCQAKRLEYRKFQDSISRREWEWYL